MITGGPEKSHIIESVLNFLSYFLRSGLVEKQLEVRCFVEEDLQEAVVLKERALKDNLALVEAISVPKSPLRKKRKAKIEPSSSEKSKNLMDIEES